MGTTTNRGFPYPEASDAPDGPGQIQALAEAVDEALLYGTDSITTNGTGVADVTPVPAGYQLISVQMAQATAQPYYISIISADEIQIRRSDTNADAASITVDVAWVAALS